jgi:hypothetical protein
VSDKKGRRPPVTTAEGASEDECSVAKKPRPSPCFLDQMVYLGFKNGQKLWRSKNPDRYYTWDSLHGEIEVFTKKGRHLGALDAVTGKAIKKAVRGRKIDV